MTMLHTVNKSPLHSGALQSCLRTANEGDAVLLIEDAVYAATAAGAQDGLRQALERLKVYVLMPDLEARGMAGHRLERIEPVDYRGFVELAAAHSATQSWL